MLYTVMWCCCIVFCSDALGAVSCVPFVSHTNSSLSLTHSPRLSVGLRLRAPTRWHTVAAAAAWAHTTHVQKFVKYTVLSLFLLLLCQRLCLLSLSLSTFRSPSLSFIPLDTISHFVDDHWMQRSRKSLLFTCLRACVFQWIYFEHVLFSTRTCDMMRVIH